MDSIKSAGIQAQQPVALPRTPAVKAGEEKSGFHIKDVFKKDLLSTKHEFMLGGAMLFGGGGAVAGAIAGAALPAATALSGALIGGLVAAVPGAMIGYALYKIADAFKNI